MKESLDNLIVTLRNIAQTNSENSNTEKDDENMKGYYEGKASAYINAANWLSEIVRRYE